MKTLKFVFIVFVFSSIYSYADDNIFKSVTGAERDNCGGAIYKGL